MKVGIFFRHPLDRDRGLILWDLGYFKRHDAVSFWFDKDFTRDKIYDYKNFQIQFINIELEVEDNDLQRTLNILCDHYSSGKKLMDLQSHGTIFELKETPSCSDTELTRFKKMSKKKVNASHDTEFGDITYYNGKDKLEINLYMTRTLKGCFKTAIKNDWENIIFYNEKEDRFIVRNLKGYFK